MDATELLDGDGDGRPGARAAGGRRAGSLAGCLACGGTAVGAPISKRVFQYRVCADCGLASLDPLPDEPAVAALYDREYFAGGTAGGYADYEADEALHRRNARQRLRAITRARGTGPGSLLDVGCATGFLLSEARAQGWGVAGVDVSPWARERVAERFGLEVHADLQALAGERPASFDAVSLSQVLEHAARPDRMLRAARACLRPDGLLFVETWDRESLVARLCGARWQQLSPPSVVHLFGRRSLTRLLARQGFAPPAIRRALKLVSLGLVRGLLRDEHPRLFGRRGTGAPGLLARVPLPYFLGDLIQATATATRSEADREDPDA